MHAVEEGPVEQAGQACRVELIQTAWLFPSGQLQPRTIVTVEKGEEEGIYGFDYAVDLWREENDKCRPSRVAGCRIKGQFGIEWQVAYSLDCVFLYFILCSTALEGCSNCTLICKSTLFPILSLFVCISVSTGDVTVTNQAHMRKNMYIYI